MLEEDPEMENAMREALMKAEKYEKDALENFLELMVSKEFQSIFDIYKQMKSSNYKVISIKPTMCLNGTNICHVC